MNRTRLPLPKTRALTALLLTVCIRAFGNNLVITTPSLQGQNTTLQYVQIQFNVSWDNSWRVNTGPGNWDAAWIFIKYRHQGQTIWHHATLNYADGTGSGDGHTEPAGSNISSSNDNGSGGAFGVFIHAAGALAQSNVSYNNVKLRWNYGADGLANNDKVEICVFGMEMVYVPQGSFYAGSGGSESGGIYTFPVSTDPFLITGEGALTVGNNNGDFNYTNNGDNLGPIPADFPKGYKAFYCMKYEISQAQYAAFLNKLNNAQAAARFPNISTSRNGITGTPGNYQSSNPYVACNFLNWADLAAFLDWACLRPMTELEFEKAARGSLSAVNNEYAWGNTLITAASGIDNAGNNNETPNNATANCNFDNTPGVQGPMRVGCFGQGINTRTATGSGYYGIMELSGNVFERTVTVGNPEGRNFTGLHGNGVIDASGLANVTNWPDPSGLGMGFRGGSWDETPAVLRVSDRFFAINVNGDRSADFGGRGCRTAP